MGKMGYELTDEQWKRSDLCCYCLPPQSVLEPTIARGGVVGPNSAFPWSLTNSKVMVEAIRGAEKALSEVRYKLGEQGTKSRVFRRSLFVVKDMKAGEVFTEENVRSIRPGYGLPPKFLKEVLGRRAACDIKKGTPLKWRLIC